MADLEELVVRTIEANVELGGALVEHLVIAMKISDLAILSESRCVCPELRALAAELDEIERMRKLNHTRKASES